MIRHNGPTGESKGYNCKSSQHKRQKQGGWIKRVEHIDVSTAESVEVKI